MKWVELKIMVSWDDDVTEDITVQLPQYLIGEVVAHINEIEAIRNGTLPRFTGEKK